MRSISPIWRRLLMKKGIMSTAIKTKPKVMKPKKVKKAKSC